MSLDLPDVPPGWPWPWPGGENPPQPTTHYVQFPDGHIGQITGHAGTEPVLPEGSTLLTQEQYEALRAQLQDAHDARLEQLLAAEEAARLQQYQDLLGVGLPDATARSLSGYDGPQPTAQAAS
jgi:hypothetical protein